MKWMAWITAALSLALVGCGSTNKREIKKTAIDTEDARLTGYLEGLQAVSCSPLCTPLQREVDVDEEAVLDEAILRKTNGEACFDVTIRTTLGYDRSIDDLSPTCTLDATEAPATVSNETFSIFEFGEDSAAEAAEDAPPYRVVVADMTEADLHATAGEATSANTYYAGDDYDIGELRIVERKAHVCCPGAGATTVQLTLGNGIDPVTHEGDGVTSEPPSGLDFVWFIVE